MIKLKQIKMKKKIITSILVTIVILLIISFSNKKRVQKPSIISTPDLSNHPIYSTYKFDKTKDIINIGTQPLYLPTGMISESMKRDGILLKALSKLGMKIRFYSFLKGDDVNFFLGNGSLDIGIGGDMPTISATTTMDIIIPIMIQQGFTSVIANHPMLIRELRGKRIGYAFGSNAHYALLKALSSDGLTEKDVTFVPMETTEMGEALHAKRIDAFSTWEPNVTMTLVKYQKSVVIYRKISSGYMYFLKPFSDKHPEAVRQIIAAEIRAIRWALSNKKNLLQASKWSLEAGENLSGQSVKLFVEQNALLAMNDILRNQSAPFVPQKYLKQNGQLYREFQFLKKIGKIPASSNWKETLKSFDRQILKEALSSPKKYKLNQFNYGADEGGNE